MRDVRLLPIVIVAAFGLLVLKGIALFDGGGWRQLGPKAAKAQSVPSLFDSAPEDMPDLITGSAPAKKKEDDGGDAKKKGKDKTSPPEGRLIITDPEKEAVSSSERVILERLQERRQEIEGRGKDLELRESLLKAAEKRLEERANQLRELETRIEGTVQKRDEADIQRVKNIVSMYETMRPKDAARIFDTLDMAVMLDIATRMKPSKLADVLAQMNPDVAKKLTIELARKPVQADMASAAGQSNMAPPPALPKIEGKPIKN